MNMNSTIFQLIPVILLVLLIGRTHAFSEFDYEEGGGNDNRIVQDEDEDFTGTSNVTIRWKELGFRVVCEEDEWKGQFDGIKSQMIDCLEVAAIVYEVADDEEFQRKRDMAIYFGKPYENPYCWLGKNWAKCRRLMEGLECIEPHPQSLQAEKKGSRIKEMAGDNIPDYSSTDPYDWANMVRPYKILCEVSKLQAKSSRLESFGAGF